MDDVYKITLKIELDYNEIIEYSGKDLKMAATLILDAQKKLGVGVENQGDSSRE